MRKCMLALRERIDPARRHMLSMSVADQLPAMMRLVAMSAVVASYRAFGAELDPDHLDEPLCAAGATIALPRTPTGLGLLAFHAWRPGDPLEVHRFGMREPPATLPVVRPDVLLVPLLAFDACGNRLGYGGGYYDRTLAELRKSGDCSTIGLAFCEQEVDAVPAGAYDQPLDFVLTPNGLREFDKSGE